MRQVGYLTEFSPNITGASCAGHLARIGETRSAYRVLMGKLEGEITLGRSRYRWEDNIKMDIQEVVWVAWTGLIWLMIGTGGGHL